MPSQRALTVLASSPLLVVLLCHMEAFLELLGGVDEKDAEGPFLPYLEQEERPHPMTEIESQSALWKDCQEVSVFRTAIRWTRLVTRMRFSWKQHNAMTLLRICKFSRSIRGLMLPLPLCPGLVEYATTSRVAALALRVATLSG